MPKSKNVASGRPLLLPLVYVATITLIAVSCAALAILGAEHVRATAIRATVAGDQAAIREFVATNVTTKDVDGSDSSTTRRSELGRELARLADAHGYRDATVSRVDGSVLAGDAADATGLWIDAERRQAATTGQSAARIGTAADGSPLLTEAIPISVNGVVQLIVTLQRDAGFVISAANDAWRDVLLVTVFAAVVLALLLRAIFQGASMRLRRQAEEILESRRRDHLTGFINHGAAVARLTDVLAAARTDGSSVGIALVDIDNFRLLNETYGSPAGDEALRLVARALEAESGPWEGLGRFGPDEFLAVAPVGAAGSLEAGIERVRDRLSGLSLQFGSSERLPVTVSAAVCYAPLHGRAAAELLSVAAATLNEAKASGGNAVRVAERGADEVAAAQRTSFDVLAGLVIAVDTKDRYTKRHSEDVARYAVFLARRMGLEPDVRRAIQAAGLIHDVGKIGIPDVILRKPGPLTAEEYDIVKQHVALGDVIVRDVPDADTVRDGIRHHHERWDGTGYLHRLAGESIPLVARILAVADAFSAMTSSRPYRKALTVGEALRRLEDAAGTQLESRLVAAFVEGIETAADAPLPGDGRATHRIWTPETLTA